jgi:hypothetical protein
MAGGASFIAHPRERRRVRQGVNGGCRSAESRNRRSFEQWASQLVMVWIHDCCQYGLEEVAYPGFPISRRSNA